MRGDDVQQGGMFSYVSLEARVPGNHPLRGIKQLLDEALATMSRDFDRVHAAEGRPVAPHTKRYFLSFICVRPAGRTADFPGRCNWRSDG